MFKIKTHFMLKGNKDVCVYIAMTVSVYVNMCVCVCIIICMWERFFNYLMLTNVPKYIFQLSLNWRYVTKHNDAFPPGFICAVQR